MQFELAMHRHSYHLAAKEKCTEHCVIYESESSLCRVHHGASSRHVKKRAMPLPSSDDSRSSRLALARNLQNWRANVRNVLALESHKNFAATGMPKSKMDSLDSTGKCYCTQIQMTLPHTGQPTESRGLTRILIDSHICGKGRINSIPK